MNLMTLTTMMALSTMFMVVNHPISFGTILISQTILLALIAGLMNMNFWFSYILFIVMIGGLLIMFIYMTSIASNEKFKVSIKLILILPTTSVITYWIMNYFEENLKTLETFSFNSSKMTNILSKYFNLPFSTMAIFLMLYLLLTLIVIVKLTKKNLGPMRQKY
uniref:NADH-ubiquinone oxidoreductase chain 6 n=1 Tax=Chrysolina aeruginosa TaxID=640304 RepID=A0A7H0R0D5_9CUCU|nr:NADH dehydrogenase subunit 6 [Chrysolina aeruginosa]QNQ64884.1 NADH dehydrogenase subunit 6 [Chrysolina aeruginosa]QUB07134.1 NADH dehydrogenase subunit 6 [Chrysochus chinensis]